MKVLLRKYGDKYYVWKDAVWKAGCYYIENEEIEVTDIVSIKEDNREKYVRCIHCGTIIKDDLKSIEKHFADEEAKKDCFNCSCLRLSSQTNMKQAYTKNEDGTYHRVATSDVTLLCNQFWPARSIDHPDVNQGCVCYQCRKSGTEPVSDVFMEYPGLFDKQITVDVLKANGFEYDGYKNGYFEYDLKLRGSLKACVNELGIVDHFLVKYSYYSVWVRYSEKYNKLFYIDRGNYYGNEKVSVSTSKHNSVLKKISTLYKEENDE